MVYRLTLKGNILFWVDLKKNILFWDGPERKIALQYIRRFYCLYFGRYHNLKEILLFIFWQISQPDRDFTVYILPGTTT